MSFDVVKDVSAGEMAPPKRRMAELETELNRLYLYEKIGGGKIKKSFHPGGSFVEVALKTIKDDGTVLSPGSREGVECKRFICGISEGRPVALGAEGERVEFKWDDSGVGWRLAFSRNEEADYFVENGAVSKKNGHGVIWWREGEGFSVNDLTSMNGTYCRKILRKVADEWLALHNAMQKKEKDGEGVGQKKERKKKQRSKERKEKPLSVSCEAIVIDGRSGEDKVSVAPEKALKKNKWGISFMGGVFDGHSADKSAGPLAQTALSIFWKRLEEAKGEDLSTAIVAVAKAADRDIIGRFGDIGGTCAEIVITTAEGVYLVHVGDGQAFWQNNKGEIISAELPPHKPADGGRVAGRLAVNRSWGDGKIKKMVGKNALSPVPEIRLASWSNLKKTGVTGLFVTTDGLLELVDLMKDANMEESLVSGAFQSGLEQGSFENEVHSARNRFGVEMVKKLDDVSGLLVRFESR